MGGLGITIRNEPRETVLTSIPISGGGVGNAAGSWERRRLGENKSKILIVLHGQISGFLDRVNFSASIAYGTAILDTCIYVQQNPIFNVGLRSASFSG